MSRSHLQLMKKIMLGIFLFFVVIWVVGPFLWMVNSSFKSEQDIFSRDPELATNPTIDPYIWVLNIGTPKEHYYQI